jgi:antitoxin MazE
MQTQFSRWGNSLALRIPKALADEIAAVEGSAATITVENGAIIIRPAAPVYDLANLIKGITPKNRHSEIDTGGPVGNEI